MRKDFVKNVTITAIKKVLPEVIGFAVIAQEESYFNSNLFAELLEVDSEEM